MRISYQLTRRRPSFQNKSIIILINRIEHGGRYILKPQSEYYLELPENEAVTMSLASIIGIEVPLHGLVYSKDKQLTYFTKQLDRREYHTRIAMEDFAQ